MIKVLVVEDSPTARELILAILAMDPGLKVCGVVDNGLEAVQLTKELWPDVILMDIQMPKMDGFQATKLIMSEKPTPMASAPPRIVNAVRSMWTIRIDSSTTPTSML